MFDLIQFFKNHSVMAHLLSGFVAEIASCSLWLPIDIIKERMQVQSEIKLYSYKSPTEAMQKIHRSEGIIGLYRVIMFLSRHLERPYYFLVHSALFSSLLLKN